MKEKIIDILDFPRQWVRGDLGPEFVDCPHAGQYDVKDRRCRDCDNGPECLWLYNNDEYLALSQRPLHDLLDALDFAICYVNAGVMNWGHVSDTCQCKACSWLRTAHQVHDDVQPHV